MNKICCTVDLYVFKWSRWLVTMWKQTIVVISLIEWIDARWMLAHDWEFTYFEFCVDWLKPPSIISNSWWVYFMETSNFFNSDFTWLTHLYFSLINDSKCLAIVISAEISFVRKKFPITFMWIFWNHIFINGSTIWTTHPHWHSFLLVVKYIWTLDDWYLLSC